MAVTLASPVLAGPGGILVDDDDNCFIDEENLIDDGALHIWVNHNSSNLGSLGSVYWEVWNNGNELVDSGTTDETDGCGISDWTRYDEDDFVGPPPKPRNEKAESVTIYVFTSEGGDRIGKDSFRVE